MNYQKIYEQLTSKNMIEDYTEKHHILPKCMGGSDDIENIVCLTPEAHYVAHQLLVKIYPDNHKIIKAAHMMTVGRNTNKSYGWLKRKHSESMKQRPSNRKGVTLSAETRAKMSAAKKGKHWINYTHSAETRLKISNAAAQRKLNGVVSPKKGKPGKLHSAETKFKMRESHLGEVKPKIICPHCNKKGAAHTLARWHFNNCKLKP
jgi:hypothetical protein